MAQLFGPSEQVLAEITKLNQQSRQSKQAEKGVPVQASSRPRIEVGTQNDDVNQVNDKETV
jgi:hypothetical protein